MNRPAIPMDVQREVLYQARHHCSVCCVPTPLEKAHIIPWKKTQDHSEPNLVALCANCHERADNEKWGEDTLRKYKKNPCALERDRMPAMSPEQKAMVELIIAKHPDFMNEKERLRLASMTAAYVGVSYSEVRVVSVEPANSCRVLMEMPLCERIPASMVWNPVSSRACLGLAG